jgi:hypothetical protein
VGKGRAAQRPIAGLITFVVGVLIAAGAGYALYEASRSDTETAATPNDIGVILLQNPFLRMVVEEGTLYVEVRDASGTVVCAMGVMSPDDRQPCEETGDDQDLTVFGNGPHRQSVQAGLE